MIQPPPLDGGGAFSGSIVTSRLSSGMPWYTLRYDSICTPIAPSCSFRYASAFAWPGWWTSLDTTEVNATRWSLSLAMSICAMSAAVPSGVGLGAAVGVGLGRNEGTEMGSAEPIGPGAGAAGTQPAAHETA